MCSDEKIITMKMQTKTIVVEEEGEEQPTAKSGKIIECKTRKGGRQIGGGMTGRQ